MSHLSEISKALSESWSSVNLKDEGTAGIAYVQVEAIARVADEIAAFNANITEFLTMVNQYGMPRQLK